MNMTEKPKDGGSAFPIAGMDQRGDESFMGVFQNGLTKREWFAGMALSGNIRKDNISFSDLAADAFKVADAMISEGEK